MTASAAGSFAARVRQHRIIAILRDVPDTAVEPLETALVEGGIRLIEVALSRPSAVAQMQRLKSLVPPEVSVGASTVTDVERAEAAQAAGAEYLVTPHVTPAVNAFAVRQGLGLVCGALTPTEISAAREGGSAFVKVFPASVLGPAYFRALPGALPRRRAVGRGRCRCGQPGGASECWRRGRGRRGCLDPRRLGQPRL